MAARWPWLAILAILSPGLLSCAATTRVNANPIALASSHPGSERRIESMVHDWFALLEGQTLESSTLDDFLAKPSFEFSLAEGTVRSPSEFRAWLSNLRSTYPQIEYRIDAIRVDSVGEGLYQARFELDRRALDKVGAPHIARREHIWLVRDFPGNAPVILQIDERPLLPFPGTGPKIICE